MARDDRAGDGEVQSAGALPCARLRRSKPTGAHFCGDPLRTASPSRFCFPFRPPWPP